MYSTYICETSGCPEKGVTADSVMCPSCGKERSRSQLKQKIMDRIFSSGYKTGVKINEDDYTKD